MKPAEKNEESHYPPSYVPDNEELDNTTSYSVRFLERGKVAIGPVDLFWGSSGKGKFNGLIAGIELPDFVITHNSIQASHVYVNGDFTYKFAHLPTSVVNHFSKVVIGAGAMVNLNQLEKEIIDWRLDSRRLFIHPNVGVITSEDVQEEQKHNKDIASTMTGSGAAAAGKLRRLKTAKTIADFPQFKEFVCDTYELVGRWLKEGWRGLIETAQGADLSLDHSMVYTDRNGNVHKGWPYTTYRNADPISFAGMSGIGRRSIGNVIANVRSFPIRVGDASNTSIDELSGLSMEGSSSGEFYQDQLELTWQQVTAMAGSSRPIQEKTSLTKRLRRVFTFSMDQYRAMTRIVQPDFMILNFANYVDASIEGVKGRMSLADIYHQWPKVGSMIAALEVGQYWYNYHPGIFVFLGTGADNSEFIEIVR